MAKNTCLRLKGSIPFSWLDCDEHTLRRRGEAAFWELRDPVYPGMEIGSWVAARLNGGYVRRSARAPFGGPWLIEGKDVAHIGLEWWLFADNAPVKQGNVSMEELGFEKAAGASVDRHPEASRIRLVFPTMP